MTFEEFADKISGAETTFEEFVDKISEKKEERAFLCKCGKPADLVSSMYRKRWLCRTCGYKWWEEES